MAALPSSSTTTPLLPLHFPSSSSSSSFSRRTFVLCHSSSPESASPSLSDQLHPLSLTLLKDPPPPPPPPPPPSTTSASAPATTPKPKPTWLNPSRPRPSVLSLRRHPRPPFSHNTNVKHLSILSRSLSSLPDPSSFSAALSAAFSDNPPSRQDALFLLLSLKSWPHTHQFFLWLQQNADFPLDAVFYNVLMKSLRAGRQFGLVEDLAGEMVRLGVQLDNVTYSTIISTAKRCREYSKAISWFERMYKTGVIPDEVTYSAILDVYARLGKKEEVLILYDRARGSGWTPDAVAFAMLAKMFGEAGDYDGIQYVLKEMKELGVRPNLVVYNTLLEALGKAGKPGLARSLFDEMVNTGLSPNEKTLTALIKIYGKARWSRDALELWERMRTNKWPMDFILYNTLLSMCADLGLEEQAQNLFDEMPRPDSWSYTAMINIYGSGGKVERAMEVFDEMLERGVEPNVMGCTCLIQCLGKGKRIGDAIRVFGIAMERGIKVDDRLCGCLLSLVALCEDREVDMVLECLEKANPRLVGYVKLLGNEETSFDVVREEFQYILNEAATDVRRPFCNCLIDICRNRDFPSKRAHELLYLGNLYGLYPGLYAKGPFEWSLNLRSLSVGAANTAFEEWMKVLSNSREKEEDLPQVFAVHTGAGSHKFSQGLASAFVLHLEKMAAPFRPDGERGGYFVASKEELLSWMESRAVSSSAVAA